MPIMVLELNELNFHYIQKYVDLGRLPNFKRLIDSDSIKETKSEPNYPFLEPWIQWPTVYTGLTQKEHGLFRLGDAVSKSHDQIWEKLEREGYSVGAISPMNAVNRCQFPNYFLPDPWTKTKTTADLKLTGLYDNIANAVNSNASKKITIMDILTLGVRGISFLNFSVFVRIAREIKYILKYKWAKAAALDMFLFSLKLKLLARYRTDFSTLFLNAGAHIQHHHTYDSMVYDGKKRNPAWYSDARNYKVDPLLFIYEFYDWMIGYLDKKTDISYLVLTGLSQKPNPVDHYQYRIVDSKKLLSLVAVDEVSIEMRMSRDFLLKGDRNSLKEAKLNLEKWKINQNPLFAIDDRGDSLFCQVSHFGSPECLKSCYSDGIKHDLSNFFVLVSIENAIHQTTGYLADPKCLIPTTNEHPIKVVGLEKVHDMLLNAVRSRVN